MLYGIGCDLCEIAHLEKSLTSAKTVNTESDTTS